MASGRRHSNSIFFLLLIVSTLTCLTPSTTHTPFPLHIPSLIPFPLFLLFPLQLDSYVAVSSHSLTLMSLSFFLSVNYTSRFLSEPCYTNTNTTTTSRLLYHPHFKDPSFSSKSQLDSYVAVFVPFHLQNLDSYVDLKMASVLTLMSTVFVLDLLPADFLLDLLCHFSICHWTIVSDVDVNHVHDGIHGLDRGTPSVWWGLYCVQT